MIIIGAGLAGCLAGCLEPNSTIIESGPKASSQHKAVLRFREDKISRALGIPFRPVRVLKGVYSHNDNAPRTQCTVRDLNWYSKKVIGRYEDRSIINLEPVTRYIAPEDFHEQLVQRCNGRIEWNTPVLRIDTSHIDGRPREDRPIISTMPLSALANVTGTLLADELRFSSIVVKRFEVEDCDVHQTIYFPDPEVPIYRATMTGKLLLLEAMEEFDLAYWLDYVAEAFGMDLSSALPKDSTSQRYGKIHALPAMRRKEILLQFTMRYNVYSLGRFACWRNVLLDDVYEDFFKIRNMIRLNHYDLMRSIT